MSINLRSINSPILNNTDLDKRLALEWRDEVCFYEVLGKFICNFETEDKKERQI